MKTTHVCKAIITTAVLASMALTGALTPSAFAGGNPGYENCVPRPSTTSTAGCATDCSGLIASNSCSRVNYFACNDCVGGSSTCPAPSGGCQTSVDKTTCFPNASGVCHCSTNWVLGKKKAANQAC
jgi:hypothetical protein